MQVLKTVLGRLRHVDTKKFVVGGVFVLALVAAVGLGTLTKQHTSAATVRECEHNSIDYKPINGGCGAADAHEYISDLRQNDPADLQVMAANFSPDFHLVPTEYDSFAASAQPGVAFKDGHVEVNGQTVLTNSWSIGRDNKPSAWRYPVPHDNTAYYANWSRDVFAVNTIPVMVYFANDGTVQFIAMNPCGNLMGGNKVKPQAECRAINMAKDGSSDNPNAYVFTTDAVGIVNATISRVVYHFSDDGTTLTVGSPSTQIKHIFKKSGQVTVDVYAKVPGNHEILIDTTHCVKNVQFVAPKYACDQLVATALDDKNRNFRFAVIASYSNGATLKDVDFTLDSTQTTKGVTAKDSKGRIYKDYNFTDDKTHTIVASVNFNTAQGVVSATCKASVTPQKPPMCTLPGKENFPPESPQCKPETPPTPPTPPQEMPNTGPGDVIGLFAGTSIFGAIGHRLVKNRRRR